MLVVAEMEVMTVAIFKSFFFMALRCILCDDFIFAKRPGKFSLCAV